MKPGLEIHDNVLGTDRIETLSDGIFAIVMTLLVLEIHVPEIGQLTSSAALMHALVALAPKFLSYVISVVVLGTFWIGHHLQFYYIKHSNRTFLWINIVFFAFISLIPFSAALLGNYHHEQVAVIMYGLNLIASGILISALWIYANNGHRLVHDNIDPKLVRIALKYMLMAPIAYAIGIAVSFWSITASLYLYAIIPILYILPSKLDSYLPGFEAQKRTSIFRRIIAKRFS
jgi:uncharacterized membrane protein